MTEIHFYNTRTRTKERFVPLDPEKVRMYVCGPTVYDRAHIGNARPVVVFDTLFRLLRHVYGEAHVAYVRNITDVEDKINARAAESGRTIEAITEETTRWYHEDMGALGVLQPTQEPRATAYIPEMVAMIETLVARGHAYAAEGHVLFAVASYPDYGRFANRSLDEMQAGARVEVAPYKRDPMDFVLWKPSPEDVPGWPSPWGRGRPGWHIECSAMSEALLGASFDIHGGGIDLVFPHHENEIAQSRCAHPEAEFARYWVHNGFLNVEGEKMSKSLGNFFTVRELLDGTASLYGGKQSGPEIRMALLLSHYRDPMDYGVARMHEARATVEDFADQLGAFGVQSLSDLEPHEPLESVISALSDDISAHVAIAFLRRKNLRRVFSQGELRDMLPRIYASQRMLGFDLKDHPRATMRAHQADGSAAVIYDHFEGLNVATKIAKRIDAARAERDFERADQLRAVLIAAGIEVRSGPEGTVVAPTPNFDPAKLDGIDA
ncbi:MAG TPA: cysteine--tRNA ligase [Amaricoccus sp.]|nr:cysteine--tRNA ligase [Amaricoccus sp.]